MNARAANDADRAELLGHMNEGLSFEPTQAALLKENPGLLIQAQTNGLLLSVLKQQRFDTIRAHQNAGSIAWLHLASIVALLMILWRVW